MYPSVQYHPTHGMVMTSGKDYSLDCYDLFGHLNRRIQLDRQPESVTRTEREEVIAWLRDRVKNADNDRSRITSRKQLEIAEFQDPKGTFSVRAIDAYGYIWTIAPRSPVMSSTNSRTTPARYLIIDPDGEYIGDTELSMRRVQIHRGYVTSIEIIEETGLHEVVVYRIVPIADGFAYPN